MYRESKTSLGMEIFVWNKHGLLTVMNVEDITNLSQLISETRNFCTFVLRYTTNVEISLTLLSAAINRVSVGPRSKKDLSETGV